jgi:hypothetical protein
VFVQRRRDARVWGGAAAGIALALLHPLYYALRLGIWSPLRPAVVPHWPGMAELTAVLGTRISASWCSRLCSP